MAFPTKNPGRLVTVAGAAALWDYIFTVDKLPEKGDIVKLTNDCKKPLPGGCAPSIASGIAKLCACNPQLYYPVGYDIKDGDLLEQWTSYGVDCSKITINMTERSGYSFMYMQEDGVTMCFAYAGAAADALPEITEELGEWVIIAPVLNSFTTKILKQGISDNKKIVLTGIGSRELLPYLERVFMLVINVREAQMLADSLDIDSWINNCPVPYVYVTQGKKGSVLYHQKTKTHIPIIPEKHIKDFSGAGDAYTSGVVSAFVKGYSPVQAGYVGSANSSFVVEEYGGQTNLPTWEKLLERLNTHAPGIITPESQKQH